MSQIIYHFKLKDRYTGKIEKIPLLSHVDESREQVIARAKKLMLSQQVIVDITEEPLALVNNKK